MVIGLLPNADIAGECLSNLEEADFAPKDLSVVMKTPSAARDLARVSGSLNALTPDDLARRLEAAGLSAADASAYRDRVLQGNVFIAIDAGDASDAAKEMLADARAEQVRVVGSNRDGETS